ncbi:RNA-binding domain-containing protein [Cognataquiflexum rubidum]|uniref:RNA-binding domain-containing protein n=1 Tax=Cognataquiflexum rubidum TaxID=2922273 RepID=UPI001F13B083|nr:RNA-binding domain-containing protein [Cognataquiflexum rubidum]MCH6236660.1 putative DNA binding domain-containing protein [Cognataquiflexum rubidum]
MFSCHSQKEYCWIDMALPINIQDLIIGRAVESERIEYKKGWNPGPIYRSICAFANDFDDIGGGYIIVGFEEENGRPVLPPTGLNEAELDGIQRDMVGMNNLINPAYHPKISVEEIQGKKILVIWAFAGDNRPYEVPDEIKAKEKKYNHYIRYGSCSIKVNKNQKEELISLSGKTPFDDRPNTQVSFDEISLSLVRDYLRKVESKLLDTMASLSKEQLLSQMQLLYGSPERLHPRNVALMMFTEKPENYFPYSRVEIVHFPNGDASDEFFEIPNISGPVDQMINQTLTYLKVNVLRQKTIKVKGSAESVKAWNYPFQALEEIVANALYHRDYQTREPVEIRVYSDKLMIVNYGGPDRSIKLTEFKKGTVIPRRYRNRRLGDFLKELDLTEGKATGIPAIIRAMEENGSPKVVFDTDEDRSFFHVTIPIHPEFMESTKVRKSSTKVRKKSSLSSQEIRDRFGENALKILLLLREDGKITAAELAQKIDLSSRAVQKNIVKMRSDGILDREGPTKSGEWIVLVGIDE